MRYSALAFFLGALLGFSLAEDFFQTIDDNDPLNQVSLSTDNLSGDFSLFSDAVGPSQDSTDWSLLAFDDDAVFPSDGYSEPLLLASTCDDRVDNNDGDFLLGKLRARDSSSSMCFTKDPATDSMIQEWLKKIPQFFRGNNPDPEPESPDAQKFGLDQPGNQDKCKDPPWIYNLCCEGDVNGNLGPVYNPSSVPPLYSKVQNCYESV